MKASSHAVLQTPKPDDSNSLSGEELRALLIRCTKDANLSESLAACTTVHIFGHIIKGELDLRDLGSDSSPLPRLVLESCVLHGGIDLSQSWCRGLHIKLSSICSQCRDGIAQPSYSTGAPKVLNGSIWGKGTRFKDKVLIEGLSVPPHCEIDFSLATLGNGCHFVDVGRTISTALPAGSLSPSTPLSCINISGANVNGSIDFAGLLIESEDDQSVFAEELTVSGAMSFTPSDVYRCVMGGCLHLSGAKIEGQLLLRGVNLAAKPQTNTKDPAVAFLAEGISVGADLLFRPSPHEPCVIEGPIHLVSARVGGDLQINGEIKATNGHGAYRSRAIKARGIVVGGNVSFGRLGDVAFLCRVIGQADFSMATIAGRLNISGSTHEVGTPLQVPEIESRRPQKCAVRLVGAKIGGDLLIEQSTVHGLMLTGVTTGGRLVMQGADIIALSNHKAISANGSTFRGGLFLRPDLGNPRRQMEINGDFRLRNATVDGPAILTGVKMSAGTSGVAFWASNSRFNADLILEPSGDEPFSIQGEIRLWGSTVAGSLRVEGAVLASGTTGAALDCYKATIKNDVFIGEASRELHRRTSPVPQEVRTKPIPSSIVGVLNFGFVETTSITIGSEPPYELGKRSNAKDPALTLIGALVMRNLNAKGTVVLADLKLRPGQGDTDVRDNLERRSVFRKDTVIDAVYAQLGNRLWLRLAENSRGLINLYGSRTGTIGALAKNIREHWGAQPDRRRNTNLLGEEGDECIYLNVGEFSYRYMNDVPEDGPIPPEVKMTWRRWLWFEVLGRPTRPRLQPRYDWLSRQIDTIGLDDENPLSPWRQMAKTYREMGNLRLANEYSIERRWRQIGSKKGQPVQRFLDSAFGFAFGFGYSSNRALAALVALFLLSFSVVLWTASQTNSDHGPGAKFITRGYFMSVTDKDGTGSCALQPVSTNVTPNFPPPPPSPPTIPPAVPASVKTTKKGRHTLTTQKVPSASAAATQITAVATGVQRAIASSAQASIAVAAPVPAAAAMSQSPPRIQNDFAGKREFWMQVASESVKLILPFTRFEKESGCSLYHAAPWQFHLARLSVQLLSWIIFTFAAITFSGILRESN